MLWGFRWILNGMYVYSVIFVLIFLYHWFLLAPSYGIRNDQIQQVDLMFQKNSLLSTYVAMQSQARNELDSYKLSKTVVSGIAE